MVTSNLEAELSAHNDPSGFVGRIPVRNLWLLMLYASDLFRTLGVDRVALEQNIDHLPDLIAKMLIRAVELRRRRQLSLGYRSRETILSRVRGRIDVLQTECRHLLEKGSVACRFEELSIDNSRNRFVRYALENVSNIVQSRAVARQCRAIAGWMKVAGVSASPVSQSALASDRFGRRDRADALMLELAKLAFDLALPTEAVGSKAMFLPDREETWVRRLFEQAVGGFYEFSLPNNAWRVRRGAGLAWQIDCATEGIDRILPSMRTDIILDQLATRKRLIIDTKFTSIVTTGWHREETIRSGYLYQIHAYLRSQGGRGNFLDDNADGILLHPAIDTKVDQSVFIQGHKIRFATVDLSADANLIRERLLEICSFTNIPIGK